MSHNITTVRNPPPEGLHHYAVVFLPENLAGYSPWLLQQLIDTGQVMLVPKRAKDDLFIIQAAMEFGATVLSRDLFRDHVKGLREGKLGKTWVQRTTLLSVIGNTKRFYFEGDQLMLLK